MNNFQERVLDFLNINHSIYQELIKNVTYDDIENPNNFINIDKCTSRILSAISNNEKIMIYGDYDCDGICATSILVKMFQYLNIKVGYYIPSRYIDGYGLNISRSKQIVSKKYDLLITVDNGISAYEEIKYLKDNGVDVILTDHHDIINDIPPADIIIHSDLKKDAIIKQCGAYLAFMISIKVLGRIDDYLLSLATLATISDMMPLINYNRNLVKMGLKIMNSHPEYSYLMLKSDDGNIDEETLGFTICPKINAVGRLVQDKSVNDLVIFLVSNDQVLTRKISFDIEKLNTRRKYLINEIIKNLNYDNFSTSKVIVYRYDNIPEGVIGLVASHLVNDLNKPAFVFTKNSEGILKGSGRSIPGLDLSKLLKELSNYLLNYGGHEEACGLSLDENNFAAFTLAVNQYAQNIEFKPTNKNYLLVNKDDFTFENYLFINELKPFGIGFPYPVMGYEINTNGIFRIGDNKQHIRGRINSQTCFIGFNIDASIDSQSSILSIGKLSLNKYRGQKNLSFKIEKVL